MAEFTTRTTANASPEQVLGVLTDPGCIATWSPVPFELEDLDGLRLAAGTRARVTGSLAGVKVGFDVEVHAADQDGLELSADGPISLDVFYDLAPAATGTEVTASVALRKTGGITGRLIAKATQALLAAGALDGAAGRIARAAETAPTVALAA